MEDGFWSVYLSHLCVKNKAKSSSWILMKFGTLAGTIPCNKYQLLGTTGQHEVVSLEMKNYPSKNVRRGNITSVLRSSSLKHASCQCHRKVPMGQTHPSTRNG